MRAVAETEGAASNDDRIALASADLYIFEHKAPFVLEGIARWRRQPWQTPWREAILGRMH
jgi:hypothetical protein